MPGEQSSRHQGDFVRGPFKSLRRQLHFPAFGLTFFVDCIACFIYSYDAGPQTRPLLLTIIKVGLVARTKSRRVRNYQVFLEALIRLYKLQLRSQLYAVLSLPAFNFTTTVAVVT